MLTDDALRAYVEYGFRDRADGTSSSSAAPEDEAATYAMGVANGVYQRLGEIGCPVLVACGEHTDAIVPALAEMIVDRLPQGRLEIVPGLGHFGPLQDPDAVAASILAFARS